MHARERGGKGGGMKERRSRSRMGSGVGHEVAIKWCALCRERQILHQATRDPFRRLYGTNQTCDLLRTTEEHTHVRERERRGNKTSVEERDERTVCVCMIRRR